MPNAMWTKFSLITSVLLASTPAGADEIDLTSELKRILFSQSDKAKIYNDELPNSYCHADGRLEAHPFLNAMMRCGFKFENVRAIGIDVKYSNPKPAAIPLVVVQDVWKYQNCGNVPLPIADVITLTAEEGSSVTKTTTVTRGSSTTTEAGVTIPISAAAFNFSTTVNYSFSQSDEDRRESSARETRATTQNIAITVPARSIYSVTLQKEVTNSYIDYDGIVQFEADAIMYALPTQHAKNPQGTVSLGKLSQAADPQSRTVHLKGQIWNAKGHDMVRTDLVTPISGTSVCKVSGSLNQSRNDRRLKQTTRSKSSKRT